MVRLVAKDAIPSSFAWPAQIAKGVSGSDALALLIPQDLARRLLPAEDFRTLMQYAHEGVPTDCGPDWSPAAIQAARAAGPHDIALLPENVTLMWEDIEYQVKAGFVSLISETQLFGGG